MIGAPRGVPLNRDAPAQSAAWRSIYKASEDRFFRCFVTPDEILLAQKKKKRPKAIGLRTLCNTDYFNCLGQFLILIILIIA